MGVPAFAPDTPMLPACQIARSFQQENNRSLPPASDAARCSATLPLPPYRLRTACYDRKRYKFAHHSTPNNKKSLSAFILLRFPLEINIPLITVYDLYTVFAVNYPQGGDAMYYSEFGKILKSSELPVTSRNRNLAQRSVFPKRLSANTKMVLAIQHSTF